MEIRGTLKETTRILKEIKEIVKEIREILKEINRTNPHIKRPLAITGAGPKWAALELLGPLGSKKLYAEYTRRAVPNGLPFRSKHTPGKGQGTLMEIKRILKEIKGILKSKISLRKSKESLSKSRESLRKSKESLRKSKDP